MISILHVMASFISRSASPFAEGFERVLQTENFSTDEMRLITTTMNERLNRGGNPQFLFHEERGNIQDVGHVPNDHPDSQVQIKQKADSQTTKIITIVSLTLLTVVTLYVIYRNWEHMRDISLEIANRTARTVMLERFELIRNNPRLVEDISRREYPE